MHMIPDKCHVESNGSESKAILVLCRTPLRIYVDSRRRPISRVDFTAPQARAHGASRQLVEHHVPRGRFERVRRGLYRVHGFPRDEHDDMREAWMAVGARDALLSHRAHLHCSTSATRSPTPCISLFRAGAGGYAGLPV